MALSENGLLVELIMVDSCNIMRLFNLILGPGKWLSDGALTYLACTRTWVPFPHQKEKEKIFSFH